MPYTMHTQPVGPASLVGKSYSVFVFSTSRVPSFGSQIHRNHCINIRFSWALIHYSKCALWSRLLLCTSLIASSPSEVMMHWPTVCDCLFCAPKLHLFVSLTVSLHAAWLVWFSQFVCASFHLPTQLQVICSAVHDFMLTYCSFFVVVCIIFTLTHSVYRVPTHCSPKCLYVDGSSALHQQCLVLSSHVAHTA